MATLNLAPQTFTHPAPPTHPLRISFTVSPFPAANPSNPIYPATHLQVSYRVGGQEMFSDALVPRDILCDNAEDGVYSLSPGNVPAVRVRDGQGEGGLTGEVVLHAWKGDKLLDSWVVGRIQGMGVYSS
ncbi:hypothetical protein PT974_09278 [Cladobotryum mycophilum]|uniref:Uncharacterized protein n=1 Tax=Cladobotryum mycophilum TaxID=491253 RepID=A0ABR0SFN6_9HYPO